MDYNNIFNLLFIFFITVVIAYLFGFTIVYLIDERLNKFTLDNKPIENFNNNNNNNNNEKIIPPKKNFNENNKFYNIKKNITNIEGYFDNNSFEKWHIDKKKTQVCIINHNHMKDNSDIRCTYGLTNYADPKDMSPIDLKIFNLNYPTNMTLQDYINWLFCYIDKEDQLPYNHLKNLEKLKNGIELIEEEGVLPPPSYYYPALNSNDYFDKMYNDVNEFSIASPLNSTTGPMMGYNYNEYSEFSQNFDLNGLSGTLRNEDIFKKKNAKKLNNYINPKDSNSINIENDYEIYHIKKTEI